jgi:hypothetical protein
MPLLEHFSPIVCNYPWGNAKSKSNITFNFTDSPEPYMKATSISFVGFDVLYDNVPNITLALNGVILYQQPFETVVYFD